MAKHLTVIPAQLPTGTQFVIDQPEPGRYVLRYDPAQAHQPTDEQRAADRRTLAALEAAHCNGAA